MGHVVAAAPARATRAWLQHLAIRGFRNLARADLAPPPEGLALVGENGQGKTNFLEAIYYLQLLRSFRGARDQDLVAFGEPGFHLAAEIEGGRAHELSVGFERAGKRKRVRLNGAEPTRLGDAIGAFPAVILSPHDAELVAGAPSGRRRYLDVMLSLTSRAYLHALQRYRAALAHRNAALRAPRANVTAARLEAQVAVWEPALAEHGAVLWRARRAWSEAQVARYGELCAAIGERGAARLRYVSQLDVSTSADTFAVATALVEMLARRRELDVRRGLTHTGPHRDDLELTLDGRDLRTFGSAGQQRTAAIVLRLLEAATLRDCAGAEPVVLLDDPFAELDPRRAGRILDLLNVEGRGQTVLAVPREADIPAGLTRLERWRVADGVITRAEP